MPPASHTRLGLALPQTPTKLSLKTGLGPLYLLRTEDIYIHVTKASAIEYQAGGLPLGAFPNLTGKNGLEDTGRG